MKRWKDDLPTYALLLVFVVIPVALISSEPVNMAVGSPLKIALLAVGILIGIPAFVFLAMAIVMYMLRIRKQPEVRELMREQMFTAVGMGFLTATATITLALYYPAAAVIYVLLSVAYVWASVPESRRHLGYLSSVVVQSTPEAAFALVSDPRNWHRFHPEVEAEAVDMPLHVGSLVWERVTVGRTVVSGQEEVTFFEPGRRFGTALLGGPGTSDDYEFTPVAGGTQIVYSFRGELTIPQAVLGGVFRRASQLKLMLARRELAMQRIQQILEPAPRATV